MLTFLIFYKSDETLGVNNIVEYNENVTYDNRNALYCYVQRQFRLLLFYELHETEAMTSIALN